MRVASGSASARAILCRATVVFGTGKSNHCARPPRGRCRACSCRAPSSAPTPSASWSTPVGSMKPMSFFAKRDRRQRLQRHAVVRRVLADRRVHRAGEAVEEAATGCSRPRTAGARTPARRRCPAPSASGSRTSGRRAPGCRRRRRPRVTRATCSTDTPFFISVQQPVGRHLQPARDGDAAAVGQQLAQLGREGLLEADVAPPARSPAAAAAARRPAPSAPSAARPRRRSGSRSGRSRATMASMRSTSVVGASPRRSARCSPGSRRRSCTSSSSSRAPR